MSDIDKSVIATKELRQKIDAVIQDLKRHSDKNFTGLREPDQLVYPSRERSLALTKLQEAVMWLGMDLKALNESRPPEEREPRPYPSSYDPSSAKVEPTADGLRM